MQLFLSINENFDFCFKQEVYDQFMAGHNPFSA